MKKFKDYFSCVPILETERFVFVPFAREDMDEYFDILRDERVQKGISDLFVFPPVVGGGNTPKIKEKTGETRLNQRFLKKLILWSGS